MRYAKLIIKGSTIVVGNKSVTWDHPAREQILEALVAGDEERAICLMSPKETVLEFGKGKLKILGDQVFYNGQPIPGILHNRIFEMAQLGFPVEPLLAFYDRLQENPDAYVRAYLYGFLEHGKLPLTEDGCFLAKKATNADGSSFHCGTDGKKVDWSIGAKPKMAREACDVDSNVTCSRGLHVYSKDYGKQLYALAQRICVVKVDPRAVVAIPQDYKDEKIRCWSDGSLLEVVEEVTRDDDPEWFGQPVCTRQEVKQRIDTNGCAHDALGRFCRKV